MALPRLPITKRGLQGHLQGPGRFADERRERREGALWLLEVDNGAAVTLRMVQAGRTPCAGWPYADVVSEARDNAPKSANSRVVRSVRASFRGTRAGPRPRPAVRRARAARGVVVHGPRPRRRRAAAVPGPAALRGSPRRRPGSDAATPLSASSTRFRRRGASLDRRRGGDRSAARRSDLARRQ